MTRQVDCEHSVTAVDQAIGNGTPALTRAAHAVHQQSASRPSAELPVRPVDHLWKGLIMLTNLTPGESDFARRVLQELLGPE
ncbi:hypothetical protein V2S04_10725 [Microbacterium sp. OR21]|uniref:hypothetical protein n=1 Tax=Microbacterium sp. OR21 TaxID=3095346 RepID=UPI0039B3A207